MNVGWLCGRTLVGQELAPWIAVRARPAQHTSPGPLVPNAAPQRRVFERPLPNQRLVNLQRVHVGVECAVAALHELGRQQPTHVYEALLPAHDT